MVKKQVYVGYALSILPMVMMFGSATAKITRHTSMVTGLAHFGYPPSALVPIGLLEACCALLYAIPRTAPLGAILVTCYLGGAAATHVRLGEAPTPAVVLGILVWLGLWLRDARLRALLPLRSKPLH